MNATEPGQLGVMAAIAAMALATYLTRTSGFWMMAHVPLTPRLRRMLEALPGSVVVAIIVPIAVKNGLTAIAAVAAAAGIMVVWRNEFLALAAGVAVAALMRAAAP